MGLLIGKQAQVTLFVILGIVLLILAAGAFYLLNIPKASTSVEVEKDLNIAPVQDYVVRCLYEVGRQGVNLIGAHGGYIYPERFGITANPLMPTSSEGVSMFEGSEIIPYWFYLKSGDACTQGCIIDSERPPLANEGGPRSVEAQLEQYVEDNIAGCIANLTVFEEQGIISEVLGSPKVNAVLKEGQVDLALKQTIRSRYEGKEYKMSDFRTFLPVNLLGAYRLMNSLVSLSSDENVRFFEKKTIQMIASYGMGKDPVIPPITGGTDIGKTSHTWQLTKANDALSSILEDHSSVFSVANTRNSYAIITGDKSFNGIYNDFAIHIQGLLNPENYSVDFVYLSDWPLYLSINPRKGNTIAPENSMIMGLIPITVKDFYYDVSYPFVIIIKDEKAFGGEGYTFQAALEINVRSNQPINISGYVPTSGVERKSLFCDYNQKKSGEVTVQAKDTSDSALTDASVIFSCGDESCFVGDTGDSGVVIERLPLCVNGILMVQKEDFFISPQKLSTAAGVQASLGFTAEPYKEVEVFVKKMRVIKQATTGGSAWSLEPSSLADLEPDDKALITVSRKPGVGEEEVIETVNINGKIPEDNRMRLIFGDYEIYANIMTNLGPQSVSKEVIRINQPDDSEMLLDSAFVSGSVEIDSTKGGLFTITREDLEKGKITFIVPYVDPADLTEVDDLSNFQSFIENLVMTSMQDLLPRFG